MYVSNEVKTVLDHCITICTYVTRIKLKRGVIIFIYLFALQFILNGWNCPVGNFYCSVCFHNQDCTGHNYLNHFEWNYWWWCWDNRHAWERNRGITPCHPHGGEIWIGRAELRLDKNSKKVGFEAFVYPSFQKNIQRKC